MQRKKIGFLKLNHIYTLPHDIMVSHWLWPFVVTVCPSFCCTTVHPYFCFQMITWLNVNGFSLNLVCALILWRSGLGLLIGKFRKFFNYLPTTSIFSFPDNNLSKYQWTFTRLGICIDCGLGLLMGKFFQFLTELSARDTSVFSFQENNMSKYQRIFTKLDMCIDIVEIWFWIAIGYMSSIFYRVFCPWFDNGGVLSFHVFIIT